MLVPIVRGSARETELLYKKWRNCGGRNIRYDQSYIGKSGRRVKCLCRKRLPHHIIDGVPYAINDPSARVDALPASPIGCV